MCGLKGSRSGARGAQQCKWGILGRLKAGRWRAPRAALPAGTAGECVHATSGCQRGRGEEPAALRRRSVAGSADPGTVAGKRPDGPAQPATKASNRAARQARAGQQAMSGGGSREAPGGGDGERQERSQGGETRGQSSGPMRLQGRTRARLPRAPPYPHSPAPAPAHCSGATGEGRPRT